VSATAHIALLRGINVGKRTLPMPALAQLFLDAGCTAARTYIQSGNVVFRSAPSDLEGLGEHIADAIEKDYGFRSPVVIRSAEALAEVAENNPFLAEGADEKTVHVVFLADLPTAAQVKTLEPDRSPPDRFVVRGADVYLHLPNGVADSKLTNAWFDSRLKTVSTGRNWRTVLKLLEMARALEGA
jgi:uncharacterized protein (DUF1697 family)